VVRREKGGGKRDEGTEWRLHRVAVGL